MLNCPRSVERLGIWVACFPVQLVFDVLWSNAEEKFRVEGRGEGEEVVDHQPRDNASSSWQEEVLSIVWLAGCCWSFRDRSEVLLHLCRCWHGRSWVHGLWQTYTHMDGKRGRGALANVPIHINLTATYTVSHARYLFVTFKCFNIVHLLWYVTSRRNRP